MLCKSQEITLKYSMVLISSCCVSIDQSHTEAKKDFIIESTNITSGFPIFSSSTSAVSYALFKHVFCGL